MVGFPHVFVCLQEANQLNHRGSKRFNHEKVWVFLGLMDGHPTSNIFVWFGWWNDWNPRFRTCQQSRSRSYFFITYFLNHVCKLLGFMKWVKAKDVFSSCMIIFVIAYGAINDPCVFVIFADWMQVALEIDACATDVTSLGWGGVGMLTFMLTCATCTTDVTSLGWGGVGMLTFMLTCVTCTTDVTSLGWGGVGMLTFMLTCVTCTTDVTSVGWGGVGMLTFMLTCVTCTTDWVGVGWGC